MKIRMSIAVILLSLTYANACKGETRIDALSLTAIQAKNDGHAISTILNTDLKLLDIPVINSRDIQGDLRTSRTQNQSSFVKNISGDMYGYLVSHEGETLNSKDFIEFRRLLEFRNLLLIAGGSGNACLAGSLTTAIHYRLFNELILGKNHNIDLLLEISKENRVEIKQVLKAMMKDDRWTTELSTLSMNGSDLDIIRQYLSQCGADQSKPGLEQWMEGMKQTKSIMYKGFDKRQLASSKPITPLMLWAGLVDAQNVLILSLEYEKNTGAKIRDCFPPQHASGLPTQEERLKAQSASDSTKLSFKTFLDKNPPVISLLSFKPIDSKYLIDVIKPIAFSMDENNGSVNSHIERHLMNY